MCSKHAKLLLRMKKSVKMQLFAFSKSIIYRRSFISEIYFKGELVMKKVFCLIALLALCFTGCENNSIGVIGGADGPTAVIVADAYGEQIVKSPIKMFMADGELYYDTGIISDIEARCGTLDGLLEKGAKENEIPQKSGKANFDTEGYQSATGITKEVCIDGKWCIFKRYEDIPKNLSDYKYCFYIKGRYNNAESDSEFIVLTDNKDISFSDVVTQMLSSHYPTGEALIDYNLISTDDKWGITLYADDITNTGLTLNIEQLGKVDRELLTGRQFELERNQNGNWRPVTVVNSETAWNDVAYIIKKNDVTAIKTNWKAMYGELPAGYYRLTKEIIQSGEGEADNEKAFESEPYTVYFTIE